MMLPPIRHQRDCTLRQRHQAVATDVQSEPKARPAGIDKAAAQILSGSERDRVDEKVDAAEMILDLFEQFIDSRVVCDIALFYKAAANAAGQGRDPLLQHLPGIAESERRPLLGQRLGDPPGD